MQFTDVGGIPEKCIGCLFQDQSSVRTLRPAVSDEHVLERQIRVANENLEEVRPVW